MEAVNTDNTFSSINPAVNNAAEQNKPNDELSQSDFVELLVAQVKNQDPTKPMDPSQFMSQLTQSSMVNGISELQNSFDSLASKLTSDQSLQAAGLVGKDVLLPGGEGLMTAGGSINGQLSLERQASEVKLNIFNTQGELVKTLPLGGHNAGELQFKWDGIGDAGSALPEGHYLVTAEALIDGETQAIEVALESRIDSISLNQNIDGTQTGTLLNLSSGQTVTLDEIQQIN
ncbi:MAG: flagellar hook assembly protein FlgD [Gammaproteobacteria bacterium]